MTQIKLTNELVVEMTKSGVIYGHKKSKTHPRMRPYIAGNRNEVELIDPEATVEGLAKVGEVIKGVLTKGGLVLFVGTSAASKALIEQTGIDLKMPYVVNRWLGGTLTNFKMINSRLKYYEELKVRKEKGLLAKYTKKEQLQFDKEISKMSKHFDGLSALNKLPDLVFIVDIKTHVTALKEAATLKLPVAAVIDTNDNPDEVTYPIFANDHSKSSVEWVINKVREEIK